MYMNQLAIDKHEQLTTMVYEYILTIDHSVMMQRGMSDFIYEVIS